MFPTSFKESNLTLGAPPGAEDRCSPLSIFTDGKVCVSVWVPTAEDLEAILAGGPVYLIVHSGVSQPPVSLTAVSPFVVEGGRDE